MYIIDIIISQRARECKGQFVVEERLSAQKLYIYSHSRDAIALQFTPAAHAHKAAQKTETAPLLPENLHKNICLKDEKVFYN